MNDHFHIVEDDRLPALKRICYDNDGVFPLTSVTAQTFTMTGPGGTITGTATIEDAVNGVIRYDWGATDTNVPGLYRGRFKVTISSKTMSFPSDGYIMVTVAEST